MYLYGLWCFLLVVFLPWLLVLFSYGQSFTYRTEGVMTERYVVYVRKNTPIEAFAMRERTWGTMLQMHKDRYGEAWEEHLKPYEVVAQGLSEKTADGLVELISKEKA
jgi:hypothetical protein